MNTKLIRGLFLAGFLATTGCVNDGSGGGGGGGLNPGGGGPIFPNDGSVPTDVTDDGVPIAGNFICTKSARAPSATTEVAANGLVGSQLSDLLNSLGGESVTNLTNSITDKDLTIDGDLETGSSWTLTVGLLGAVIDSLDQTVLLSGSSPAGSYAVFGLQFPEGTLELTLLNSIEVTTYLNDVQQESRSVSQAAIIDLLGGGVVGDRLAFIGMKVTEPYDQATVSLVPSVLSANVGEAMKVHELCTGGRFVNVP